MSCKIVKMWKSWVKKLEKNRKKCLRFLPKLCRIGASGININIKNHQNSTLKSFEIDQLGVLARVFRYALPKPYAPPNKHLPI